jgi:hypothetical protein
MRSWTKIRSEIALHARDHPDQPIPPELYAELREARAADYITKTIASVPKLSQERRNRLAVLILSGGGSDG